MQHDDMIEHGNNAWIEKFMPLHELIYISDAAHSMVGGDLEELLERARKKNDRLGITGILVYHERRFMQLLEGEKALIDELFETIRADRRHRNVLKVWDYPIEQRNFPEWSMAYAAPDPQALRELPGYSEFLARGLDSPASGSTGRRLLLRLRDDFLRA